MCINYYCPFIMIILLVIDFLFCFYLLEMTSFGYSVFNNLNELQLPNFNVGELCTYTNCCECDTSGHV